MIGKHYAHGTRGTDAKGNNGTGTAGMRIPRMCLISGRRSMMWTQGHRNSQHALHTVATGEASEEGPDQQASNDVQACQETRRR